MRKFGPTVVVGLLQRGWQQDNKCLGKVPYACSLPNKQLATSNIHMYVYGCIVFIFTFIFRLKKLRALCSRKWKALLTIRVFLISQGGTLHACYQWTRTDCLPDVWKVWCFSYFPKSTATQSAPFSRVTA